MSAPLMLPSNQIHIWHNDAHPGTYFRTKANLTKLGFTYVPRGSEQEKLAIAYFVSCGLSPR